MPTRLLKNNTRLLLESHLKHAISLIKHDDFTQREREGVYFGQVMEETPGGGDDDVGVLAEGCELVAHAVTADLFAPLN